MATSDTALSLLLDQLADSEQGFFVLVYDTLATRAEVLLSLKHAFQQQGWPWSDTLSPIADILRATPEDFAGEAVLVDIEDAQPQDFQALNLARERLYALPTNIVFVASQDAWARMLSRAHDFTTWIALPFTFTQPEGYAPLAAARSKRGLSPELMQRLRQTLLKVNWFEDPGALRALFVDARLEAWRDSLPEANMLAHRVEMVIATLLDQTNAEGENALVLLLDVLRDRYAPEDRLRAELAALAEVLRQTIVPPAWDWEYPALADRWASFDWLAAAARYRAWMLELHGTLRVLGKPEPVSLEGVFTDVFILDKPHAFRRFDLARLREDPAMLQRAERISGLRLVTQPGASRLFILGQPGAGKTTFLKYLTLQAAQGKLDKIPIFVGLNEWSESGLELLPFVERQFAICAFPDAHAFIKHILEEGDALVLFDGLDEVRQEADRRANVVKVIRDFSNQYLKSQVLVTCRVAATEYELSDKFTYVELADFTEDQMRAYARKWFSDDPKKGEVFEAAFFDKAEHRGLREMGRTPLLLAMLCLHFEETQTFPQRRVELYEEALDALLKKWDATRNIRRDDVYRKLSLGRKRELLATLASETFDQSESFFLQEDLEQRIVAYLCTLPPSDMDEDIDGEAVLRAIEAQHGILVERVHRIHAFAHLSFQEYFTAKYVVENNALARLFMMGRIKDRRWREVLLLTASLLYEADDFFAHFFDALETEIRQDAQLVALLRWADSKAHPFLGAYKVGALRAVYIYLARARGHAFDHNTDLLCDLDRARDNAISAYSRFRGATMAARRYSIARAHDRDRDLALARDLACDLNLDRERSRGLDLELALVRTRTPDLVGALNLVRDLVLACARARDCDLALVFARISPPPGLILDVSLVDAFYFARIFGLAHHRKSLAAHVPDFIAYLREVSALAARAQLPELAKALSSIQVPAPDAPQAARHALVEAVKALLMHRDLHHDFGLSNAQTDKLGDYLEAAQLLVECLNLARVSDRAALEARILQPPEDHHG